MATMLAMMAANIATTAVTAGIDVLRARPGVVVLSTHLVMIPGSAARRMSRK